MYFVKSSRIMKVNPSLSTTLVACILLTRAYGTTISISDMNADSDSGQLEGTLAGTAINGTSTFAITAAPSIDASSPTFADYTVSGVDLDGDNSFSESFSFRITFSSSSNINFSSTRETLGVNDETFDLGESFNMSLSILSDSSLTHEVSFTGFSTLDFISLTGTDLSVTSAGGNTTVTLLAGNTDLGGFFTDPTFTYANTGNLTNSGTFEDWSLAFSTSPVPEPQEVAILLGLLSLSIACYRKGR